MPSKLVDNILTIGMCIFLFVHSIIFMFDGFGPLLDERDLAKKVACTGRL